jgi:HSP20 family protein
MHRPVNDLMQDKRTTLSPVYANIQEFEDKFIVNLTVPGYEKAEISIALDENKMKVSGKKEAQTERSYQLKEYDFSNFERLFYLPANVQFDKIEASVQNGILTILIPKPEVKPKVTIAVK